MSAARPRLLDLFCGAGGAAIRSRFWKYVAQRSEDECWPWVGSRRDNGYGQLNIAQYPFKAHRLGYLIHYGILPDDMEVLHTCDNPPCCNPTHLFLGTQADNMADASQKGRCRGKVLIGVDNRQSKLNDDLVREARGLHADGLSLHQLARQFNVDRKTITQAIRGERWSHVH